MRQDHQHRSTIRGTKPPHLTTTKDNIQRTTTLASHETRNNKQDTITISWMTSIHGNDHRLSGQAASGGGRKPETFLEISDQRLLNGHNEKQNQSNFQIDSTNNNSRTTVNTDRPTDRQSDHPGNRRTDNNP